MCRGVKQKNTVGYGSVTAIAALTEKVKNLCETGTPIESSMQLLSNKYDTVITDMTNQQKQMADIKRRVERMETSQGNAEINNLKKEMNELEWHNRKLNLELHGIQKTEHENLLEKVNAVAASLNVPELTESDVTAVHRLPSKPDKTLGLSFASLDKP